MGGGLGKTSLQPNGNTSLVSLSTNPHVTALSLWVGCCVGPHPRFFWGPNVPKDKLSWGQCRRPYSVSFGP